MPGILGKRKILGILAAFYDTAKGDRNGKQECDSGWPVDVLENDVKGGVTKDWQRIEYQDNGNRLVSHIDSSFQYLYFSMYFFVL